MDNYSHGNQLHYMSSLIFMSHVPSQKVCKHKAADILGKVLVHTRPVIRCSAKMTSSTRRRLIKFKNGFV